MGSPLLTPPANDPLAGNQTVVQYNFEWYKFVAYALRQIIPAEVWASPPATIGDQIDTLVFLLGQEMIVQYPREVLLLPPARRIVTGNAQVWVSNTPDWFGGHWHQSTPAVNDEFEFEFMANAGNYNLLRHGTTANNCAIMTWKCDGATIGTPDDWYSAAATVNVEHSTSFTITGNGKHVLNGKALNKNVASSNFDFLFSFIKVWR